MEPDPLVDHAGERGRLRPHDERERELRLLGVGVLEELAQATTVRTAPAAARPAARRARDLAAQARPRHALGERERTAAGRAREHRPRVPRDRHSPANMRRWPRTSEGCTTSRGAPLGARRSTRCSTGSGSASHRGGQPGDPRRSPTGRASSVATSATCCASGDEGCARRWVPRGLASRGRAPPLASGLRRARAAFFRGARRMVTASHRDLSPRKQPLIGFTIGVTSLYLVIRSEGWGCCGRTNRSRAGLGSGALAMREGTDSSDTLVVECTKSFRWWRAVRCSWVWRWRSSRACSCFTSASSPKPGSRPEVRERSVCRPRRSASTWS